MDDNKYCTFKLEISCDSAAFDDMPTHEIADLLRKTAARIAESGEPVSGNIRDTNGNTVGTYWMEETD